MKKARGNRSRPLRVLTLLLVLGAVLMFAASGMVFFRNLSARIAVNDAGDLITARVNQAVARMMAEGDYEADYFVRMEKDDLGRVTAVSCNMGRINALSASLLDAIVNSGQGRSQTVKIPLGSLTGISLLMGRGPAVPVEITVLTSSRVVFDNSIVTAGINQTKHQITLRAIVDIEVLVPWGTAEGRISTELLIADTVIVGQVPETYWNTNEGETPWTYNNRS